jgi:hypothetical protein
MFAIDGHEAQIPGQFSEMESTTRTLTSRLDSECRDIQKIENDNKNQINSARENAYTKLEEIVELLLSIEKAMPGCPVGIPT